MIKWREVVNEEYLLTYQRTIGLWRTLLQVGSEFVGISEINFNYKFFYDKPFLRETVSIDFGFAI